MSVTEWHEPEAEPDQGTIAKLLLQDHRLAAMEMRNRGYGWAEIAEKCGYASDKTAAKSVKTLRERVELESVTDYRAMQIDRCHSFLRALEHKVEAGNERAIETSLRILDKLDKLVGTEVVHQTATVDVQHTLVIESSTEDDYIAKLKALSPPQNDVVDAEVVED